MKAKDWQGYETFENALRMKLQMFRKLLPWLCVVYILAVSYLWVSRCQKAGEDPLFPLRWAWTWSRVQIYYHAQNLPPIVGRIIQNIFSESTTTVWYMGKPYTTSIFSALPYFYTKKEFLWRFWGAAGVIFPLYLFLGFFVCSYFFRKKAQKELHSQRHIRGGQAVSASKLAKLARKHYGKGRVSLTKQIVWPEVLENRHLLVVGASGTGKSTLIKSILSQLRENEGVRNIIFDLKGEYTSVFFDPDRGDIIFNPIDTRCVHWDIYADIRDPQEVYDIARSFVPPLKIETSGAEKYFSDAARDVFGAILEITARQGGMAYDQLADLVLSDPFKIKEFLEQNAQLGGQKAIPHIAKPDSNQVMGVVSTMAQFLRVLDIFRWLDRKVSLRDWLTQGTGWLFLPMPPAYSELLAPAMTAVVSVLMKEALSLPDDLSRRIFFTLDEVGNLLYLKDLPAILDLGRSKGCGVILGTQDLGKINKRYGRDDCISMTNNCTTWIVLRVADPTTAEFFSKALGEAEIEETRESQSFGPADYRDGMNYSRAKAIRRVFLPSELQGLPDLNCIVKIGHLPPAKDEIPFHKYESLQPALELREMSWEVPQKEENTPTQERPAPDPERSKHQAEEIDRGYEPY